jgi:hypothetical protein
VSIYSTAAELGDQWAAHQCALMGLRPGNSEYDEALKLAETRCAWQVAELMRASKEAVLRLGGPR